MKNLFFKCAIIAMLLTLTGCSSEPKDMVKEYIQCWGKHDFTSVKKHSSKSLDERISKSIDRCTQKNKKEEIKNIKNSLYKLRDKVMPTLKNLTDDLFYIGDDKVDLKAVYTFVETKVRKHEVDAETKQELKLRLKNLFADIIVTTEYKDLYLEYITNRLIYLSKVADNSVYERDKYYKDIEKNNKIISEKIYLSKLKNNDSENIQKQCIKKVLSLPKFTSMNILGVDKFSVDNQRINIELVLGEDSSLKSTIEYELINKKWLVANTSFLKE